MTIELLPEESDALSRLAAREKRDMRQQAALLVRRALQRRGLLRSQQASQEVKGRHDEMER